MTDDVEHHRQQRAKANRARPAVHKIPRPLPMGSGVGPARWSTVTNGLGGIDWERLLDLANRVGVPVVRVDDEGDVVRVTTPPPRRRRPLMYDHPRNHPDDHPDDHPATTPDHPDDYDDDPPEPRERARSYKPTAPTILRIVER